MGDLIPGQIQLAYYLTSVVKGRNSAENASETTKVNHLAVPPKERIESRNPCSGIRSRIRVRKSHHLAELVYEASKGIGSTQGSQIALVSVLPEKRPSLSTIRGTEQEEIKKGKRVGNSVQGTAIPSMRA